MSTYFWVFAVVGVLALALLFYGWGKMRAASAEPYQGPGFHRFESPKHAARSNLVWAILLVVAAFMGVLIEWWP